MVKKDINLLGDITIIIPAKIIEKNLLKCLNICIKKYPNTPKIVMLDHLKNPPILKSTKFLSTGSISIGAKRNIGVKKSKTIFTIGTPIQISAISSAQSHQVDSK